jgi:4-hydroxybenzoate polyprenyltransferase
MTTPMTTPMTTLGAYIRLMRPRQWVKNGFVLVGLIFGHGFADQALLAKAGVLFAAFCLVSSGVYVMNDVLDREADRAHPGKRDRPVARGAVPAGSALAFALALAAGGLALAHGVSPVALGLAACYIVLNLGYSAGLKHVVILDVFLIAAGFMLRILAGTLGLDIAPSHWLLLCGLLVTVFLGFAKRRAELFALSSEELGGRRRGTAQRRVLDDYSPKLLDQMIAISAAGAMVAYALYTVDAKTIATQGTDRLVYTVPFVLYGLFRYLYVLYRGRGGADPAAELLGDAHLLIATAGWLAVVLWLIA